VRRKQRSVRLPDDLNRFIEHQRKKERRSYTSMVEYLLAIGKEHIEQEKKSDGRTHANTL
jgi:Arc/MetJ-type ribon-helix-helix transcriptional regulator